MIAAAANLDAGTTGESRSPWHLALRRFRKNKRALLCLFVLATMGLATILVPVLSPHDYRTQDYNSVSSAPNARYWMGTDGNGRDLMVRVFLGGRISFAVGILATAVSVFLGLAYGSVSAFLGGKIDLVLMRFVDVLYGLPHMFIVILVMAFLGRSFVVVFMVLGVFSWMTMARIVRGQILSLKEREFVEAARALGTGGVEIIMRHMIPNILGPVIVYTTLSIPAVMLQESFLSFLGLGISEPETTWGVLINEGAAALNPIKNLSWLVIAPGTCLAITLFCLNAIGDGLRDAFDVQQR